MTAPVLKKQKITTLAQVSGATCMCVRGHEEPVIAFGTADGTVVRVSSDGQIGSVSHLPAGLLSLGGNSDPAVAGFTDGSACLLSDDLGSLGQVIADPVPNGPIEQAAVAGDTGPASALLRAPRRHPRIVPRGLTPIPSVALIDLAEQTPVWETLVPGATGVAMTGVSVFVGVSTGATGRLCWVDESGAHDLGYEFPRTGRLGIHEAGDIVLICHPDADLVTAFMPESGMQATMSFATVPGRLIEAHGLADGRTAVLTT